MGKLGCLDLEIVQFAVQISDAAYDQIPFRPCAGPPRA